MPKQEIPDKLKREKPDPKAFDRFKNFSKAIVQVPKVNRTEFPGGPIP